MCKRESKSVPEAYRRPPPKSLPPPTLAELVTCSTYGATVRCLLCDRGVGFLWQLLIDRYGASATCVAIGRGFRCQEFGPAPVLEVRWRGNPTFIPWEQILSESTREGSS